jgi:DNA-binding CsgD family transcriptional regulator
VPVASQRRVGRPWPASGATLEALGDDLHYMVVETQIGRSWAQYCLGLHGEARRGLREATTWAIESDEPVAVLLGLTELARLDDATWAVAQLDALPSVDEVDGPLASARLAFIRACAGRTGAPLLAAARGLAALGAHLLAAEAANLAIQRLDSSGNARDAAAAQTIVTSSLAHCADVRTPALVVTSTAVALSKREIEVATLAASGASSRLIAERLFVSARTVENHLQRVYIKLGITGRDDLAEHLRPAQPESVAVSSD